VERFTGLDCVVNNAGAGAEGGPIAGVSVDGFDKAITSRPVPGNEVCIRPRAFSVHLLESGTEMRKDFGHSGRLISSVGTPHRLSVLFERFKCRLVTRPLGLPRVERERLDPQTEGTGLLDDVDFTIRDPEGYPAHCGL
jgi:hypothetical protein